MTHADEPDSVVADDAVPPTSPPAPEGGAPHTRAPAVQTPRTESSGAPDPNLALFMAAARDPAVDVAKLERLMALRKEVEEDSRKRAFYAALALAKGEFGPILKTRQVDYPHKDKEGQTKYSYEQFADIGAVVDPILARHGLGYRHRTVQAGGKLTVTCILSHAEGYSEENTLEGLEDKSGQKNANQAVGSTVTYLQRYTLKQALGIGAKNDDDGMAGDADPMITADDAVYIEQLIADTGGDLARLLTTVGADNIADMRASQFKQAAWLLETLKRRDKKAKAAADGTAQ
jgi:ERF superfamily protein